MPRKGKTEMKTTRLFLRILPCVLCFCMLFTACGRTEDTESDSSSRSEVTYGPDKNGVWDIDDLIQAGVTFPVEGLYGESEETLRQKDPSAIYDRIPTQFQDVPTGVLLYGVGSHLSPYWYDKRTGMFSLACRDPLCEHGEDCLWAKSYWQTYSSSEHMFFTCWSDDGALDCIYIGDPYGNDVRTLYQGRGNNVGRLIAEGEFLYFWEDVHKEETDEVETILMRVPLKGGSAEQLLTNVARYMPMGDKVLYLDQKDLNTYLYTIETGETQAFSDRVLPLAAYQGWVYYYTDDAFYRVSAEDPDVREKILDHICWCVAFSGGRMYYLRSSIFSQSEVYGNYIQYDLYSAKPDGSDQTFLMSFATDEIPDEVSNFWVDGNLLMIKYRTYRDFENEFHPVEGRNKYSQALIDLSTGERISFH